MVPTAAAPLDGQPELAGLVEEAQLRFPGIPALELASATHEFATGAPDRAARRLEWITSLSLDEVIATGSAYDQRVLDEWAWNLLGLCRFELGDDAGASDAFRHAEAAAPGNPDYACGESSPKAAARIREPRQPETLPARTDVP